MALAMDLPLFCPEVFDLRTVLSVSIAWALLCVDLNWSTPMASAHSRYSGDTMKTVDFDDRFDPIVLTERHRVRSPSVIPCSSTPSSSSFASTFTPTYNGFV